MRINVYAEEITGEHEVVSKVIDQPEGTVHFYGIRMFLASPDVLHHTPSDDDRSAITLWVPWTKATGNSPKTVSNLLRGMADELDEYTTVPKPTDDYATDPTVQAVPTAETQDGEDQAGPV